VKEAPIMAEKLNFLLLGGQSVSVHEILAEFFHRESYGILTRSFLSRTASTLQNEVDRLSSVDRRKIPIFANIQQLNQKYHEQTQKTSALDCALLCITQLALYIE